MKFKSPHIPIFYRLIPKLSISFMISSTLLFACQAKEDEFALYLKEHSKAHKIYETHAIEKAIAVETVTLPAIISIPPEKQKWLHLPMDGQILNWQIKQGDLIKTGTTLAELRLSEMLDLEANIKQIQQQITQQTQYVELIKRQRKSGVADERQLQEAQLTLASLQNQSNALTQQKSGRNRLGIKGGDNNGLGVVHMQDVFLKSVVQVVQCYHHKIDVFA